MPVRYRLALFWFAVAAVVAWAAAERAFYVFPSAIEIKWIRHLTFHFEPSISDAILAAILLAFTWAAWAPGGGRLAWWAAGWAAKAGPWIFAALALYAFSPWLPAPTRSGAVLYLCALALAGTAAYLFRRPEDRAPILRCFRAAGGWVARRGPWFWTAAAFAALLAVQYRVFAAKPPFGDSTSQLFQGMILASGRLKWPAWEYPLFFAGPGLIVEDGWYSQYPPGHCALLAIGCLLHAPWLIGPLFGALSVLVIWDCGRLLYGEREGVLAAAFFALNPWWPIMSGTYMNHVSTLFWLALSFDLGLRSLRGGGIGAAFAAGFAFGWAGATRPFTAVAFGAPAGAVWVWQCLRRGRAGWGRLGAGAAGLALWAALFLAYDWGTTGDPFVTPYSRCMGALVTPGFHAGNQHTPLKGLEDTVTNLLQYRYWAPVAAPGLCLPLIWIFLFAPLGRREALLLAQWGLMCTIYFVYYWQDLMIGPRYIYESIIPYSLLAAAGLWGAVDRLEGRLSAARQTPIRLGRPAAWLAAGLCLASAAAAVPQIKAYRYVTGRDRRLLAWLDQTFTDPRSVVFMNTPFLDKAFLETARHLDGPLFLDHVGDEWDRRFMAAHPERIYYFMDDTGCWPYDQAPEANLRALKAVYWHSHLRPPGEVAALFHNPNGRPLPPPRTASGQAPSREKSQNDR